MPTIPSQIADLKVCLVTDWLTNLGGGEKVVKAIADLFPEAPIFTTVVNKDNIGDLANRDIRTSFLQRIPTASQKHQRLLPLLPKAIESLNVSQYDLVLSFSSAIAKSVITHGDQLHVCYIHTPARYAWEPDFDPRVQNLPGLLKPMAKRTLKKMKQWDYDTRHRPDHYIANSTTTQGRVRQYYELDTEVLYPPVCVEDFSEEKLKNLKAKKLEKKPLCNIPDTPYYLAVGRMVPYKKFPLIAEAFAQMPDRQVVLAGDGPDFETVKAIAEKASNITLLGRVDKETLIQLYASARALILPQKEDAGIVQLESFASGTPVIAYRDGGVLDVLEEGTNGVFFEEQSSGGIQSGIEKFEKIEQNFSSEKVRDTAKKYDTAEFQRKYLEMVDRCWENR